VGAVEEAGSAGYVGWHGEGEERGEGLRTHGGEVAEAAREGTVADGGGSVPGAAEVAFFEAEIGGDEEFVAGGRFQDGAVVADAEADGGGGGGAGLDAVDNR